jgi:hypothetical protein
MGDASPIPKTTGQALPLLTQRRPHPFDRGDSDLPDIASSPKVHNKDILRWLEYCNKEKTASGANEAVQLLVSRIWGMKDGTARQNTVGYYPKTSRREEGKGEDYYGTNAEFVRVPRSDESIKHVVGLFANWRQWVGKPSDEEEGMHTWVGIWVQSDLKKGKAFVIWDSAMDEIMRERCLERGHPRVPEVCMGGQREMVRFLKGSGRSKSRASQGTWAGGVGTGRKDACTAEAVHWLLTLCRGELGELKISRLPEMGFCKLQP